MVILELGPLPFTHLTSCNPSSRAFALPSPTISPTLPCDFTSSSFLSITLASRALRFLAEPGLLAIAVDISSGGTLASMLADVAVSQAMLVGLRTASNCLFDGKESVGWFRDSRCSSDM
jgi:hypothetical protein